MQHVADSVRFRMKEDVVYLDLMSELYPTVGSRVAIVSGELTGLAGRVVTVTEDEKFVLSIDGYPGVSVVISSTALNVLAEQSNNN